MEAMQAAAEAVASGHLLVPVMLTGRGYQYGRAAAALKALPKTAAFPKAKSPTTSERSGRSGISGRSGRPVS